MHKGSRISKVQLVSRLGVLIKATQSSPTAEDFTGALSSPFVATMRCSDEAATHKQHFCATQIAQSSSQKYLGLVLEWDPWSIIPWTQRGWSRVTSHPVKELIQDQRLP